MIENLYSPSIFRDRIVHIVDADPQVCEILSVLFRIEGFRTTFSMTAAAFKADFARHRPDFVVLELSKENLELQTLIRQSLQLVPVVGTVRDGETELAISAMRAGAIDVLLKPLNTEHLSHIVRAQMREEVHVSSLRGRVNILGRGSLTKREREVLERIANGQTNKEAAKELGISPRTIEVHRGRIMEKLGAKNTADLVRIVLRS